MAKDPKGYRDEIAISKDPHEISREIEETRERLSDTIAALVYKTERPVRFIERVRHVAEDVRRHAAAITQVATAKRPLPARAVALTQLAAGFFRTDADREELTYAPVEPARRRALADSAKEPPSIR